MKKFFLANLLFYLLRTLFGRCESKFILIQSRQKMSTNCFHGFNQKKPGALFFEKQKNVLAKFTIFFIPNLLKIVLF